MVVIPPFPFHNAPDEFDTKSAFHKAWKVRPFLFFRCKIRPLEASGSDSDIALQLMFFSRFFPCDLTKQHPLQKAGSEMLYDPSPEPHLFVGHIHHALGRVPLMPCFLDGNTTPTIPKSQREQKRTKFPWGQADNPRGLGSKLYEVNNFMWEFGRPKKREMSFEAAQAMRKKRQDEAVKKRVSTKDRSEKIQGKYSLKFRFNFSRDADSDQDSD